MKKVLHPTEKSDFDEKAEKVSMLLKMMKFESEQFASTIEKQIRTLGYMAHPGDITFHKNEVNPFQAKDNKKSTHIACMDFSLNHEKVIEFVKNKLILKSFPLNPTNKMELNLKGTC